MSHCRLFAVTIRNKDLAGEPDIGVCFVEADSEEEAVATAHAMDKCEQLAENYNWCRCVPSGAKEIKLGFWLRPDALIDRGYRG